MSDNNATDNPGYIDYKTLPFVKAKVKFYSAQKQFGFVTLLDENDEVIQDAFLPGTKLSHAGYEEISAEQEIYVKHTRRPKGEAVVVVKHPPGYSSNNTPVKITPILSPTSQNNEMDEEAA